MFRFGSHEARLLCVVMVATTDIVIGAWFALSLCISVPLEYYTIMVLWTNPVIGSFA